MHDYTPANVPGLPAGFEINLYESGDYVNLSLWRVRAMLKPYKEDRHKGDDALHYSAGRYADAYLPAGYTPEDLDEALQELVWKAEQMEDAIDESDARWDDFPAQKNRPSRTDYFDKKLYRKKLH